MTVRTVAPTNYLDLITVREAELHCRLVENADAAYIAGIIPAAVDLVETHINRAVLQGTYQLTLDYWPYVIETQKAVSVTSVQYYDTANVLQTVDSNNYIVTTDKSTKIHPINGYSWPTTYTRKGAVIVTYTAGYEVQNVPTPVKQAALVMVGELYQMRDQSADKEYFYNKTFENLLAGYVFRKV